MINVLHLYYDLLNLYGENANLRAIVHNLELNNIKVKVDLKTINDQIDFEKYDIVYIGQGSEENLLLALNDILKRRNDLINYIDNDKYMFLTGNAMCLFGSKINDNKSEIDALNIFDYKSNYLTKSTFKNASSDRIVGEVICTTNLIKHKVIGFQNRCDIISDIDTPIFKTDIKYSNDGTNKAEGFNYTFLDETNSYSMDTKYQVLAYTDDNRKIDETSVSYVYCFVKGTKVKTETGFKNIEDIKIGDKVYSYNLNNNSLELKKVLNTIKSNTIDTYKVTIGGKTVEMSPKHQLYIIDKGWVRAYNLNVNDKLLDVNGKQITISKIEYKKYDSPIDTYNLTIEGNNNYFVTDIQVLVHNAPSPTL